MAAAGPLTMQRNYNIVDFNTSRGISADEDEADGDDIKSVLSVSVLQKIAPVLLVMISTIIGNFVLIVVIVYKRSRRRKRVNIFIVNLAIADLTVAFITMTTELLEAVFKEWVLGPFLCKVLLYLQVVTLSSTTFLLTGMSIDRYQVIVKPLRSLAQRPNIKKKVVAAWIMAFLFSIPQAFIFVQVREFDEHSGIYVHYCRSAGYSAEWQRKIYFPFMTFYILLLPAGIMLFCYTNIARAIWRRGIQTERISIRKHAQKVKLARSPRITMKRSVISSSRRKVVFMTLSVILAYIVCLTPYFIICLIRIFSHYSVNLRNELAVSQVIFMLHSALNPILYGLFTLRKSHISPICTFFSRRWPNGCRANSQSNRLMKRRNCFKFRRGFLFFNAGNSAEASVIIANHVAKEETNIKLRNRETSKFRLQAPKRRACGCSQGGMWGQNNSYNHGSMSSDTFPVSVHSSLPPETDTAVSDV